MQLTSFLKDAENLRTCGYAFWFSQIFYTHPYY